MKKTAVIFDMDGVIFDTERVYMGIFVDVYAEYGYEMNKGIYSTLIGRDRQSITKSLYEIYGLHFPAKEIFEKCDAGLKKAIDTGKVPMKDGALEIFRYLKNNNFKMALATSSHKEKLEMQLKIHNLEEVFDEIVCADDVVRSKPDPSIFLAAARKLKVNPEECIVIEDSPAGIEAAHNANMMSIHVEDLVKANDKIKEYSEKQFKSLNEVREFIKDNY